MDRAWPDPQPISWGICFVSCPAAHLTHSDWREVRFRICPDCFSPLSVTFRRFPSFSVVLRRFPSFVFFVCVLCGFLHIGLFQFSSVIFRRRAVSCAKWLDCLSFCDLSAELFQLLSVVVRRFPSFSVVFVFL